MPGAIKNPSIASLQKQVASLNRTVRQLTKRLTDVERNQWYVDVDEHGNYSMSPAMEAEMDRRVADYERNPDRGIPQSVMEAKYRKLAGR